MEKRFTRHANQAFIFLTYKEFLHFKGEKKTQQQQTMQTVIRNRNEYLFKTIMKTLNHHESWGRQMHFGERYLEARPALRVWWFTQVQAEVRGAVRGTRPLPAC